jgi:putative transcriptional regulator
MIELRIGEVAADKNVNAKALSEGAHISYNTALGLMRGVVTRIDLSVLDRVCTVLGVQPGDLLAHTPDGEAEKGNSQPARAAA